MKEERTLNETQKEIKKEYKREIEKNGGITLNHHGEKVEQKSGFVVSIYGEEYKTEDLDDAVSVLLEKLEKINGREDLFAGVWRDEEDGVLYVDINTIEESKEDALETGRNNKQLSIFDLERQEVIYLKKYNFIKCYLISDKKYKIDYIKEDLQSVADFLEVSTREVQRLAKGETTHTRYTLEVFYILDEDGEE